MHRSAPAETIEDVADIAMHRLAAAFTRRVRLCKSRNQQRPHVELHRIVFARRKTAWATSIART
jgi:hypothetical protein